MIQNILSFSGWISRCFLIVSLGDNSVGDPRVWCSRNVAFHDYSVISYETLHKIENQEFYMQRQAGAICHLLSSQVQLITCAFFMSNLPKYIMSFYFHLYLLYWFGNK